MRTGRYSVLTERMIASKIDSKEIGTRRAKSLCSIRSSIHALDNLKKKKALHLRCSKEMTRQDLKE